MITVVAAFVCGHSNDASLDQVRLLEGFCYDPQCRQPREIVAIVTLEWHAFCYDCTFVRYYGKDAQAAQEASRKHYRAHNDHRPGASRVTRPEAVKAQAMVSKRREVAR